MWKLPGIYYPVIALYANIRSMKTISILFIVLSLLFFSCASPPPAKEGQIPEPDGDVAEPAPDTGENQDLMPTYQAYYVSTPTEEYLRIEPDGIKLDVYDNEGLYKQEYASMENYFHEPAFVELRGYYELYDLDPRPFDSLGMFTIEHVIRMELINDSNAIWPVEFLCLGTEPFWAIDIIPGIEAHFTDLSTESFAAFEYSDPRIDGDTYTYEFHRIGETGVESMVVIIRQEECSDGMSDDNHEYSSQVEYNGRTLSGCAVRSREFS